LNGELSDILWYISSICDTLGLKMEDVATYNIEKLKSRRDRGVLHGSGDNR
jgi:NTP pyrophosphatase (non-canonical NTP hydrolase)